MSNVDKQLKEFKRIIEDAIKTNGTVGKTSAIRSSKLINCIHEIVKQELIDQGVDDKCIIPHAGKSSPEIKLTGHLKQKKQDICVVPKGITKSPIHINWGPLQYQNIHDEYGYNYTENTLVINIRSQMSSLNKNTDTLFERTFAEALNLHKRCKDMVLGEVYLIPVFEYDPDEVKNKTIKFKKNPVNVEKYISFFNEINNRASGGDDYKYERCALLIVDFSEKEPKLYKNNKELLNDRLISKSFAGLINYQDLSLDGFAEALLHEYKYRFNIMNIIK